MTADEDDDLDDLDPYHLGCEAAARGDSIGANPFSPTGTERWEYDADAIAEWDLGWIETRQLMRREDAKP